MRKYLALAAGILTQACIGGIYAWSCFVPALREQAGLSMKATQLLFGGCILVFALVMLKAGRLVRRVGPRALAFVGGGLYGAGYLVAAASGGWFPLLFAGIAILSGAGIGLAYICPIVTAMRWFPKRKGLVTGLSVAGFGGGAILLSNVADPFLQAGTPVFAVFAGVGAAYVAIACLAALFLTLPTDEDVGPQAHVAGRFFATRAFWLLLLGMFCGTFSGLMVIGNLEPIGKGFGVASQTGVLAISLFAVGNAAGRIAWGWLFDRLRAASIPLSLGLIAVGPLALMAAAVEPALFVPAAALNGLAFGACFVVFVGAVSHIFGTQRVGGIYPFVFLGYGLSGLVGPTTAGWLYDRFGGYHAALWLAVALPLLAIALSLVQQLHRAPEHESVSAASEST